MNCRLLRELKKLDDKQLLVEAHLVEARGAGGVPLISRERRRIRRAA